MVVVAATLIGAALTVSAGSKGKSAVKREQERIRGIMAMK
jgi:hypothetical protein